MRLCIYISLYLLIYCSQESNIKAQKSARVLSPFHMIDKDYLPDDEVDLLIKFKENDNNDHKEYKLNSDTELFNKIQSLAHSDQFEIKKLFELPSERLLEWKKIGETKSGKELANLNLYYKVRFHHSKNDLMTSFYNELIKLEEIETAYFKKLISTKLINTNQYKSNTVDLTAEQRYLWDAPLGVSYEKAKEYAGYDGSNISVFDIEAGWNSDHEEFEELDYHDITQAPFVMKQDKSHGTAVMGIISAGANSFGIDGMAPKAKFSVHTICEDSKCNSYVYDIPIANTIDHMKAGEILLLEIQTKHPTFGMPAETFQDVFDLLETASAMGIIIIEAAGNGGINLDSDDHDGIFDTNIRDSGALLVGASSLGFDIGGTGIMGARYWATCYGNRIDLFAHGELVLSTGYGDLINENENIIYTSMFNGTSASSAIITGCAAVLQSVYFELTESYLSPKGILEALQKNATPSNSETDSIGVMPNLSEGLKFLSLTIGKETNEFNNDISVSPFITNGQISIVNLAESEKLESIHLLNIEGQLIHSFLLNDLQSGTILLTLQNSLTPGMYLLKIKASEKAKFETYKLISN